MTINISLQDVGDNLHPKITVLGVGGSGGNAVNNMMNSNLEGVDFLIANTDAQALQISSCPNKIQLGLNSTRGLGAGMRPDIGRQAAEEAIQDAPSVKQGMLQAQVLKYLLRLWLKNNSKQDAEKARWYLNRLIDSL